MMSEDRIVIETPQISKEDWEKYRGKTIALVDGKIVAAGYTSVEVFRRARELFPDRSTHEIVIGYIPTEDTLILTSFAVNVPAPPELWSCDSMFKPMSNVKVQMLKRYVT